MNNQALEALAALAAAAPPPGDANRSTSESKTESGARGDDGGVAAVGQVATDSVGAPAATTPVSSTSPAAAQNLLQGGQLAQLQQQLVATAAGLNPSAFTDQNLALLSRIQQQLPQQQQQQVPQQPQASQQQAQQTQQQQQQQQQTDPSILMAMQNAAHPYYQMLLQSQAGKAQQQQQQAAAGALAATLAGLSGVSQPTNAASQAAALFQQAQQLQQQQQQVPQQQQATVPPAVSETTSVCSGATMPSQPSTAASSSTVAAAGSQQQLQKLAPAQQGNHNSAADHDDHHHHHLEDSNPDGKKQMKRAANRRSAQLSRKRKKQFIEELKDENDELRRKEQILRSLPDLIVVFDSGGKLWFVSHSVERFLSFTSCELEGASFWDRLCEESVRLLKAAFMDSLAARRPEMDTAPLGSGVWELRLVDKDGSQKLVTLNGVVHFAGERPECVCSIRPVDEELAQSSSEEEEMIGNVTTTTATSSVKRTTVSFADMPLSKVKPQQSVMPRTDKPSASKKLKRASSTGKGRIAVRISDSGNSSVESESGSSDDMVTS